MATVTRSRRSSRRFVRRGYFSRRPCPSTLFAVLAMPMVVVGLSFGSMPGIVTAVLGLGLIILIHEFGHFAAAKACDVYVEAFAVGFGPALVSKKVGETEYRLNILPFGGYVKMLGQDDMDSTQMTSEEVAENPRAYSAKSVPRRMLIISAGVIMNMITAVLFYAIAFGLGVMKPEPMIDNAIPGSPAWIAGLRPGDRFENINGKDIRHFNQFRIQTALTSGDVTIRGVHHDDEPFEMTIKPDHDGEMRMIGASLTSSTTVMVFEADLPPVTPHSAAATVVKEPLPQGGRTKVVAVNGEAVSDYEQLQNALADSRDETVVLTTESTNAKTNETTTAELSVPPAPFRDFGLRLDIGKITAIQEGSPAAAEDLRAGDRIAKVDGLSVGPELDPMKLPDYFAERAGEAVTVRVLRSSDAGQHEEVDLSITPRAARPWRDTPVTPDAPLAIASLGITFDVIPKVLAVDEGGPAAKAGIEKGDTLSVARLVPADGLPEKIAKVYKSTSIELGKDGGWPFVFWTLQDTPLYNLELTFSDVQPVSEGDAGPSDKVVTAMIPSRPAEGWNLPNDRGLLFAPATYEVKANSVGEAFRFAWDESREKVIEIYMTLRALVTGTVGFKGIRGPIGILDIAAQIAENGISPFLTFLGYISINLAVLNFLPIPVLDGGHMVLLMYEAVFRKKPAEKIVIATQNIGLLMLLMLFVTSTFFDLGRIVKDWFN